MRVVAQLQSRTGWRIYPPSMSLSTITPPPPYYPSTNRHHSNPRHQIST